MLEAWQTADVLLMLLWGISVSNSVAETLGMQLTDPIEDRTATWSPLRQNWFCCCKTGKATVPGRLVVLIVQLQACKNQHSNLDICKVEE